MSSKVIKNMVNWIDENITNEPTLEKMADYIGYSHYYCSAQFHEVVGITFKQYVSERRLVHAFQEVKESNEKLLNIALKYGYSSQAAFTRAFVSNFGCTPNQCRKNMNNLCLVKGKEDWLEYHIAAVD